MQDSSVATERIGRYQLMEPIGGGPNGIVSRAKVFGVAGFERQFVIKRFRPELTVDAHAQALAQAARAYGSLEHPRIARLSEFGVAQGHTFTAVEMVSGLDLFRLLQETKLAGVAIPAGGALALVSQAARAVGYAHGRGLAHLGVSPTNIIVTRDGDVKVTDFGILAATMPPRPAESSRLISRVPYLAPEQISGAATSAATDVFVLGAIAFELVTGQRAYRGDNPAHIAQAILDQPPPEAPLPRPIVRVLQRCLARSPGERFPDARALADALDAALRVAPVPGTRKDIGAQVQTALERYAQLNEGNLSGMVALSFPPSGGSASVSSSRVQVVTATSASPMQLDGANGAGLVPASPAKSSPAGLEASPHASVVEVGPPPFSVPPGVLAPPVPSQVAAARTETAGASPSVDASSQDLAPGPTAAAAMHPAAVAPSSAAETASEAARGPASSSTDTDAAAAAAARAMTVTDADTARAMTVTDADAAAAAGATTATGTTAASAPPPSPGAASDSTAGRSELASDAAAGPASAAATAVDRSSGGATDAAPAEVPSDSPLGWASVPEEKAARRATPTGEPWLAPASTTSPSDTAPTERGDLPTLEATAGKDDPQAAAGGPRDGAATRPSTVLSLAPPPPKRAGDPEPPASVTSERDGAPATPTASAAAPSPSPAPAASTASPAIATSANPPPPRKESRTPMVAGILLGLGLVGAIATLVYREQNAETGSEPIASAASGASSPTGSSTAESPGIPLGATAGSALTGAGSDGSSASGSSGVIDPATGATGATMGSAAGSADTAGSAAAAGSADTAGSAGSAAAGSADTAGSAAAASSAGSAGTADTAGSAGSAAAAGSAAIASMDGTGPIRRPDAPSAALEVTSKPAGARVFIDGADQGVTPLKLDGSADHHTLAVLLPGHELYLAEIQGQGVYNVALASITPNGGHAGIKVVKCKDKERYYVYLDGVPSGMTCPTERIDTVVGQHVVEIYDIVTETRRKFDVLVKDERLSVRVKIEQ